MADGSHFENRRGECPGYEVVLDSSFKYTLVICVKPIPISHTYHLMPKLLSLRLIQRSSKTIPTPPLSLCHLSSCEIEKTRRCRFKTPALCWKVTKNPVSLVSKVLYSVIHFVLASYRFLSVICRVQKVNRKIDIIFVVRSQY